VEGHSAVKFRVVPGFPDYHPEKPGAMIGGGRSLGPVPVPLDGLGDWAERILQLPGSLYVARRGNDRESFDRRQAPRQAGSTHLADTSVERLGPVFDTTEVDSGDARCVGFG